MIANRQPSTDTTLSVTRGTQTRTGILLVEDSMDDYEATERALRRHGYSGDLYWCETTDEALDLLEHERQLKRGYPSVRPLFVLLDLYLPGRLTGMELLAHLKQDPELCSMPVVVLTSSSSEDDVERSYRVGANCYIRKPSDPATFDEAIGQVTAFWCKLVQL